MNDERQNDADPDDPDRTELRVAGSTGPRDLAMSIASTLRTGKKVTLVALGANAVSQAIKSVPIVNGFFASKGFVFVVLPILEDRMTDEGIKTVQLMKLVRHDIY